MFPAPPVFKIAPGIQSYDWGKLGSSSLAAQFAKESVPDFEVDEGKHYAELWMGTHPTLPSRTATGLLSEHLAQHPEFIGHKVAEKFGVKDGALPFLFKVLSIGTALSIQAHPDKPLAEQLYKEKGDIYKDPNHKPEMAIALTPFRAFMNFAPTPIVLQHLLTVPELSELVPSSTVEQLAKAHNLPAKAGSDVDAAASAAKESYDCPSQAEKDALKSVFEALMTTKADKFNTAVKSLVARYKSGKVAKSEEHLKDLVITLDEQYPGDVGVLCVFILNVVDLDAGQAVFLGANVPHAYISGDIIECMATSDNVVRAGLTPKLRDVSTLVSMLTYDAGLASRQLLVPVEFNRDPATLVYDPPIDEFTVLRVHLAKDEVTSHRPIEGPSIAVITNGECVISWGEGSRSGGELIVTRGDVVFLAAGGEYKWQARQDTEAFRAFVEA